LNPEFLYGQDDDDVPFEEKDRIWNLIYEKVSAAVDKQQNFAILFSGMIKEKDSAREGYSAIITDDQYELLLQNFLMWSEGLERYEKCEEINRTIKKIKK
jgi:predicted oxidoreductase (fatty acid repression mutant protein)